MMKTALLATALATGVAASSSRRRLVSSRVRRVETKAPEATKSPSSRWRKLREGAAGAVTFALYEFSGEAGAPARQESTP